MPNPESFASPLPQQQPPPAPEPQRGGRRWHPLLPALLLLIFIADLFVPLGVAWPMAYVVVLMVRLLPGDGGQPFTLAAVATVLTGLAFMMKVAPGAGVDTAVTNRVLAVAALWSTAVIIRWQQRTLALLAAERTLALELAESARRNQLALAVSQKQLQDTKLALDQSAIVATTDRAGNITYVNDKFCEISGYSREELLGQNHRLINSGTHPPEFMRDLWRTIASGHVWRGELRNRAKNGVIYWVDTTIVPLLDSHGVSEQYIAIRFDITDRKAAESRLREQAALTRLGEMATVVAHEVRNPLAGIGGALQIIGGRMPEGSEERLIIGDMIDRIGALNLTLGDVLQYARPRTPQQKSMDLLTLLQDIHGSLATDPRFGGIQVTTAGESVLCRGDAEMLRGAVFNLALNAAQAMGGKGNLRMTVHARGGKACVRVEDDGPGMSEATRERVFEPFYTTKSRGTGLGLPIVKRVVDQHDGEIRVEAGVAGGTVVAVDLPLATV